MASLQHLKKRLGGVKNIKQITGAMELVAAAKMRKAQEVALGSRAYAVSALEILANVLHAMSDKGLAEASLVKAREVSAGGGSSSGGKTTAILLVVSDKGLVGSFNSAVLRSLEKYMKEIGGKFTFVIVGQKGADYITKRNGNIEKVFTNYSDVIAFDEVSELAELLKQGFVAGKWDRVVSFSMNFISALKQEVIVQDLLPLDVNHIHKAVDDVIPETGKYAEFKKEIRAGRRSKPIDYIIEPDPQTVVDELLPVLFRMQLYHLILEANASEHSARRVAMKNATENAGDIISNLTLQYNRSRQEAITKEIAEITGTVAALS